MKIFSVVSETNIKFHENPFRGRRIVPRGSTERRDEIIIAFGIIRHDIRDCFDVWKARTELRIAAYGNY